MRVAHHLGAYISVGFAVAGCDDPKLSQQEPVSSFEVVSTVAAQRDPKIADQVKKDVAEILGSSADKIKETDEFMGNLGADSLDAVEIVMAAEESFNITIGDEDAERMVTVGNLIDYIQARLIVARQSRP